MPQNVLNNNKMVDDKLLYRIAFASIKGMTYKFAVDLLGRLGEEELFFTATTSALKALLGFDNKILERGYRDSVLEEARRELEFVKANNVKVFYFDDNEEYPQRLAECDDAPPLLYGLGDCDLNAAHVVSVVGTRHATVYGIGFVKELVEELKKKRPDTLVVSGLAYGIDVTAHREALRNGMDTAAVLAHGLSTIYPSAHRNVAVEMVKNHGILLTDYRHNAPMHRANFIARNRIVAGLSDCTLVVESAEKGGAIITANIASGYGRDVFALPGRRSDTYSRGCNRLIATNRASLLQSCDELLEAMGWESEETDDEPQKELFHQLSDDELKVVGFLEKHGEGYLNRIAVDAAIPMHRLMGLLIDMEFKGIVVSLPGGLYRLA